MGENPKKNWFKVVGIVTNPHFQKCRYIVERLYKSYPLVYEEPQIRPMLNVSWVEYLTKVRRKIGGKLWELSKPAAVFFNGEYVGDDVDLDKFIAKTYKFSVNKDFECPGIEHLNTLFQESLDKGRKFAYFCFTIEGQYIGSLLFLLYADMAPVTCENFLKRCAHKSNGYLGTIVHRIAKPSWIQVGGFNLTEHKIPCENYTVPHDRRGVLSMTNAGRHKENSTQFHVALNPTPWMDFRYVAFGQLVQGEEVLQQIEKVETHYEYPKQCIQIVKCGEFTLTTDMEVKEDEIQELTNRLKLEEEKSELAKIAPTEFDICDHRDLDSVMHESRYQAGLYSLETDLRSYWPFINLPDYLILALLREQEMDECEECVYLYPRELLLRELAELQVELPDFRRFKLKRKVPKLVPYYEELEGEEEPTLSPHDEAVSIVKSILDDTVQQVVDQCSTSRRSSRTAEIPSSSRAGSIKPESRRTSRAPSRRESTKEGTQSKRGSVRSQVAAEMLPEFTAVDEAEVLEMVEEIEEVPYGEGEELPPVNEAPASPEVPSEVPVEAPTEVPLETSPDVPPEAPAEAPPDASPEVTPEAPLETSVETPAEVPAEASSEAPPEQAPIEEAPIEEGPIEEGPKEEALAEAAPQEEAPPADAPPTDVIPDA